MICAEPALWHAFHWMMFWLGCIVGVIGATMFGRALYCDLRLMWHRKPVFIEPLSRSNIIHIGFTANRRRHPAGFVAPN